MSLLAGGAISASAQVPARRLKVLVAGGHPGDPEYGCGGTPARYADLGHAVTFLYLNRGDTSCSEPDARAGSVARTAEAEKACSILNARPVFAGQCDAHSVVDNARYDEFRALLERENPDIVFTHWPIDNHRDHRAISNLVYDAWSRSRNKFALFYYEVSDGEDTLMFQPAEYVDISAVEKRKRAACYAHASQSPDRYYAMQDEVARFRGVESGFQRAEGFVRQARSIPAPLP